MLWRGQSSWVHTPTLKQLQPVRELQHAAPGCNRPGAARRKAHSDHLSKAPLLLGPFTCVQWLALHNTLGQLRSRLCFCCQAAAEQRVLSNQCQACMLTGVRLFALCQNRHKSPFQTALTSLAYKLTTGQQARGLNLMKDKQTSPSNQVSWRRPQANKRLQEWDMAADR